MSIVAHDRLFKFYDAIFRCDGVDTLARDLLRPLADLFNASSVALLCYSDQSGKMKVSRGIVHALEPASVEIYSRYYFTQDPIFAFAESINRRMVKRRDYVTQYDDVTIQYGLSENFHDFLRSIDIGQIITGIFPVKHIGHDIVNLGIHRRPGDEPFNMRELALLEEIKAAVSCVISNSIRRDALDICQSFMDCAGDSVGALGVIVIRDEGTVCHATRVGLDQFQPLLDLHFNGDAYALACAVRHELGRTGSNSVCARFGWISLTAHRLAPDSQGMRTLLLLRTNGDEQFLERCRIGRLSTRETEIARLISAGLSDKAIGSQLSISTRTVQNHIRSIFLKMEVNSRTQLLSRFLS